MVYLLLRINYSFYDLISKSKVQLLLPRPSIKKVGLSSLQTKRMSCSNDAGCSFPNGICRGGACMCDGGHQGATCQSSTQSVVTWFLKFGIPMLCVVAIFVGLFLGGVSRWCYSRINEWNAQRNKKDPMFASNWLADSDRYIGPNHHTVVVKKKEKKRSKKSKRERSSRSQSRNSSRSRSPARSKSRGRDNSRGRSPGR